MDKFIDSMHPFKRKTVSHQSLPVSMSTIHAPRIEANLYNADSRQGFEDRLALLVMPIRYERKYVTATRAAVPRAMSETPGLVSPQAADQYGEERMNMLSITMCAWRLKVAWPFTLVAFLYCHCTFLAWLMLQYPRTKNLTKSQECHKKS